MPAVALIGKRTRKGMKRGRKTRGQFRSNEAGLILRVGRSDRPPAPEGNEESNEGDDKFAKWAKLPLATSRF